MEPWASYIELDQDEEEDADELQIADESTTKWFNDQEFGELSFSMLWFWIYQFIISANDNLIDTEVSTVVFCPSWFVERFEVKYKIKDSLTVAWIEVSTSHIHHIDIPWNYD